MANVLTAFWEGIGPGAVVEAGPPGLAEEDEAGVALEGDLLARVEELLRALRRPIVGTAGEPTVLACNNEKHADE